MSEHQVKYIFNYKHQYFEGKGLRIDAESFFSGVFDNSLLALETYIEEAKSSAKKDGTNLLMGLSSGDLSITILIQKFNKSSI